MRIGERGLVEGPRARAPVAGLRPPPHPGRGAEGFRGRGRSTRGSRTAEPAARPQQACWHSNKTAIRRGGRDVS